MSTDGIVKVQTYFSVGIGFFVSPNIVVTSFHVIAKDMQYITGYISGHLFIVHPETKEDIPVHSIQVIGAKDDLAVLYVQDYESPVYYELFEESKETLSSLEAYVFDRRENFLAEWLYSFLDYTFDRRKKSFPRIEGLLSSYYTSQTDKTLSVSFDSFDFRGLSGSPAFSIDGKVIGVLVGGGKEEEGHHLTLSSPKAVKELLQSSFVNCYSLECVKTKKLRPHNVRVQAYELTETQFDLYLAEQGLKGAQYNLGVRYAYGLGVAQDKEEAVKWYGMAAEQGHKGAQYNLGVMYDNGRGVIKDIEEAAKWYRLAAKQGYVKAQRALERIVNQSCQRTFAKSLF